MEMQMKIEQMRCLAAEDGPVDQGLHRRYIDVGGAGEPAALRDACKTDFSLECGESTGKQSSAKKCREFEVLGGSDWADGSASGGDADSNVGIQSQISQITYY